MKKILDAIAQTIFDKKGFNIIALDVRGISTMTDYFIIAEGNIDRHVRAIGNAVAETAAQHGQRAVRVEGEKIGDWVVIDLGELIVHVLIPEYREKYSLEQLWKDAKIVDLSIAVSEQDKAKLR